MQTWTADPTALVVASLIAFFVLLFLIIKWKMQALVSILLAAIVIGIGAGMPLQMIISTINKGIGSTLQGVALLVGLGSMFGAILEISGGVESVANKLLEKFGEARSPWALGLIGLIVATPVFFDAGLIILIPLAFGLAMKTGKSTLRYIIPLGAGLAAAHAFIPPTPGPILVAVQLNVDLGLVLAIGLVCGGAGMIVAGPIFGTFASNRMFVPVPDRIDVVQRDGRPLPGYGTVLLIIAIPLILILLKTGVAMITTGNPDSGLKPFLPIVNFVGEPFLALLIAVLVAMVILGLKNGYTRVDLEKVMTKSLEPCGMILLVTAGGGVLRWMLEDSGMGNIISGLVTSGNVSLIIVAFLVALVLRISVGSATVAMITAAGIMASMPAVLELSQFQLACLTMAIAGGGISTSHVNDSGFWLFKSLAGIDEATSLKTWTASCTLVGFTGFLVACVFWVFM